jgi:hypothetical protein
LLITHEGTIQEWDNIANLSTVDFESDFKTNFDLSQSFGKYGNVLEMFNYMREPDGSISYFSEINSDLLMAVVKMHINSPIETYELNGQEGYFREMVHALDYSPRLLPDYTALILSPVPFTRRHYYESHIVGGLPGFYMEPGYQICKQWSKYQNLNKETVTY